MALVIADLITEFEAHYEERGNASDLLTRFTRKSVTEHTYTDYATTNRTIVRKVNSLVTRVLQRQQKGWTPIGTTQFFPEEIVLDNLKVNVEEIPKELEESWLGFLIDSSLDPRNVPFTSWWLNQLVLPALEADFEKNEIYHGVQGVITPGTATAASTSMNGYKKRLNDYIAAGKTVPFVMGPPPVTAVAFYDYVADFCSRIPVELLGELEPIKLSESNGRLFTEGKDIKYNGNYLRDGEALKVHNYPVRIVSHKGGEGSDIIAGLPSMAGSSKIYTTFRGNSVFRRKKPENAKIFELEKQYLTLRAFTDFYVGLGNWIPQLVFTNNVELV